ncbi:hypothetical protein JYQ62_16135 [Nostoc sp. UHCC 0702]|nr:hypothetical protein JYQ62_16135 [Nostoc sp. UHCC 0702]
MLQTYNKVRTLAVTIPSSSASQITKIISNTTNTSGNGGLIVSANLFVKNLKAFTQIKSLASANIPDIQLEDSEIQKLYKVLDIEWKSPRYHLNAYISANNGETWHMAGALSLLNPSGYPYRIYNLMDLFTDNLAIELGENGAIGIQIADVGYGNLQASDLITIHGSYIEEYVEVWNDM